jgi:transposase
MSTSDLERELERLRRENEALKRSQHEAQQESRRLEREVEQREKDKKQLEREVEQCEKDRKRLEREVERLERKKDQLEEQVKRLTAALEASQRAGQRQAAPFSKGEPKKSPKRPGRKPGKQHGLSAWRRPPKKIDEVVDAPLPSRCPDCGGHVKEMRVAKQYQAEIPEVRPHVTQFNVHVGACTQCGRRVQGRHPQQTSDALGAAASQVGPRALALAADLVKGRGVSFGRTSDLFDVAFGLKVTPSGLCLGLARLGRAGTPTYGALIQSTRASPIVVPDETGWKEGGRLVWLWVFVTPTTTVYAILAGRGYEQAAGILGEDFAGRLVRDGWAPYRKFVHAVHQTCLRHLLSRCRELLETAQRGQARVPHAVKRWLLRALDIRDRAESGRLEGHGLLVAVARLAADMDRLLKREPADDQNRRLIQHLSNEREALLTFLAYPGTPATNWPAEQAIRPAVVTRKVCGGNRTWAGARTQQVIASILRTCRQQQRDPLTLLASLMRAPEPTVARVLIPRPGDDTLRFPTRH